MFPFFAFAVGVFMMAALSTGMGPVRGLLEHYQSKVIEGRMEQIGNAISERYQENPAGGFLTPAVIAATPGYEYLNSAKPNSFETKSALSINDGIWRFSRIAVWFQLPFDYVESTDYLLSANNACGVGDFASATSWCGRRQSLWLKMETRENSSALLLAEKQRIFRTISLFYRKYTSDSAFTTLPNGSSQTLAALTGYAGTAAACDGVKVYNGIPFTCDHLFNAWGIPIVVNQITKNHMALVNRTGVINNNGQPVRLAEEAILE